MRKTVKRLTVKEYNQLKKLKEKEMPAFLKEAKAFANNFLIENFNMRLNIPIKMNGRLTSTMGRYLSKRNYLGNVIPDSIELSKRYLLAALIVDDLEEIYDTLKHELVHYALSVQGKNFSDGDYDFEHKLYELNISASGSTPARKRLSKRTLRYYAPYKIYQGDNKEEFIFRSGKSYYRQVTVKNQKYGIYKGSLTHVGYRIDEVAA